MIRDRNDMSAVGVLASLLLSVTATTADAGTAESARPARLTEQLARRAVDEVVPEVERLRGLKFERPVPVEVIDDARAQQHMLDRLRKFGHERRLATYQEAYALLGLLPPGSDMLRLMLDAMEEQAGGFYDPAEGVFYLLSDMPANAASLLVAHELTHALEDQHFDLDQRLEADLDNEDRLFATGAVHEGSATLVMMVYSTEALMAGKLDADALQALAQSEAARGEVFRRLPAVLQRQLLAPYVLGAGFLLEGNLLSLAQGLPSDRIDRAYRDGPVSSEQVLHPDKFWGERDEPQPVSLDGVGALLGKGWEPAGHGSLGELSLGVLVGAPTPPIEQASSMMGGKAWTNDAASGWDGDRWELWRRGDQRVALLLTVWDTPADAEQFAAALPGGLASRRDGDRVALVAGASGGKTTKLLRRMLSRP